MDKLVKRTLKDIKEAYTALREDERKTIKEHLKGKGFIVLRGSSEGKGGTEYSSRGRLNPTFDLSNWKWVEAMDEERYYFISLQAFDQDAHSKNFHALTDRIGLFVGERLPFASDSLKVSEEMKLNYAHYKEQIFSRMIITEIELPMTEGSFQALDHLLETTEAADKYK